MSYGICRVEKVKASGVGAMQYHNDRMPGEHSNEDIDPERKHLNRELCRHGSYRQEVAERIERGRTSDRKVRKDAVVLAEGILTASPEWFEGRSQSEIDSFFEDGYEFCKAEFGEQNMVHFTIHGDEETWHAHFGFTPLKDGALSWKKFFPDRKSLSAFQDRFWAQVCEPRGMERGEKRDPERDPVKRHKDVKTMKAESRKELADLDAQIEAARDELSGLSDVLEVKSAALDAATDRLESVRRSERDAEAEARELDSAIAQAAESTGDGLGERYAERDSAAADALGRARKVSDECQAAVAREFKGKGIPDGAASRDRALEARTASKRLRDAIPALRERLSGWRARFVAVAERVTAWGVFSKANRDEAKSHAPAVKVPRVADLFAEARAAAARSVDHGRGVRVPSSQSWSR